MKGLVQRGRQLASAALGRRRAGEHSSVGELLNGYRSTCLVLAGVQLGVFDHLGADEVDEGVLAARVGADPGSLQRLLRALSVLGVVERRGRFVSLAPHARQLADPTSTQRGSALLVAQEYLPAWQHLHSAVLTGTPSFDAAFGTSVWQHRAEHPELDDAFNRRMASAQRTTAAFVERAFDFASSGLIVDVGGGRAELLAALLRSHVGARGIAFDQPHVLEGASQTLERAGVVDRCDLVGGSFFDSVPSGGDTYLLRHILHDWDDDHARTIVERIAEAMNPASRLLIIEGVMPDEPPEPRALVMRDLHMLAVTGGRERSRADFEVLVGAAGLELTRVHTSAGGSLLEARLKTNGSVRAGGS